MLQNIGCDYVIDSGAVEDRCGVCHGNGSTCTTVKKTFEESEGIGEICFITHYDSGLFTGDLLIPWFPLLFCSPPPLLSCLHYANRTIVQPHDMHESTERLESENTVIPKK